MTKANECTCPSGDGSLRHPCPAHPASVELAGVGAKLTFINGRPAMCGCQVEYSSGGGEYSDVIDVTLCAKHSGSAILDLVATNRIALTPEYEGQWHADFYLDREIPLAKAEGATPAEAVLALMSAERIDPEQESVEQAGGDERVIGWRERILAAHPNSDPGFWPDALLVEHMAAEIADLRAALAQPSPAQSDASFEEWLANELEGEDGQPVPAAVCDIALARRAFNHWPKLEKPAQVGGVRFSAGVSSRLVVEAAQRLYEFESTPEQEAERIERLQAFREQLDPLNLAPHAEAFNEAPAEALKPEQAEAERPELWAVHAQGPDELYAAFSREDAEKHAAELNALAMPEGITVDAVVVSSPWPPAEHWQYLAEQERDHKNEIAVRLRQFERICEGLPQDATDGCWTVQGIRGYAKLLEDQLKSALARVAELETALAPFAAVADAYDDSEDDDHEPYTDMGCDDRLRLTLGQHRAAQTALSGAPSQAQHSVPGNAAALVRAEGKKYSLNAAGMLDSGAPEHAQTFAIVQLLSEFDDEEAESHWEAIMAYSDFRTSDALFHAAELLAAAPGKDVGHE